ncbi:MAG: hypothetical protein GC189_10080 [Alphaproteobacteria bacterium]|nr:hypothetical protein [Alphaproteobacteria bacterium]
MDRLIVPVAIAATVVLALGEPLNALACGLGEHVAAFTQAFAPERLQAHCAAIFGVLQDGVGAFAAIDTVFAALAR